MNNRQKELPVTADWILDDKLAAMSLPGRNELRKLKQEGFGLVVNLTRRETVTVAAAGFGMNTIHIPVRDMAAPTQDQIRHFVASVDRYISHAIPVAVHCMGGVGRTGTMIAAYLTAKGMEPWDAIKYVRRRRPGSIETRGQENAVIEYANGHHEIPGNDELDEDTAC